MKNNKSHKSIIELYMRICILSNYDGVNNEGIKNISCNLHLELSKKYDVLHVSSKDIISTETWKKIKRFDPQILHVTLRPTPHILILSRLIKTYLGGRHLILSVLQSPGKDRLSRFFLKYLKPDLYLIQSGNTCSLFKTMGLKYSYLSNGVDTNRFYQADDKLKSTLRSRYNISPDAFVVLHVGHLIRGRNLSMVAQLQRYDNVQVIIVSDPGTDDPKSKVLEELLAGNCIVLSEYFENIHELYQLSDCYVFPTIDEKYCIETPLSILEAMACGLPVITTRFGALEDLLQAGDGIYFTDDETDLHRYFNHIRENNINIRTRNRVLDYDWSNIAAQLEKTYLEHFIPEKEPDVNQ